MRPWNRLTARTVAQLKARGLYADGGNLYLQIAKGGSRQWVVRYVLAGKRRAMGLGSARVVTLADARRKAADARKLIADGKDPLEEKIAVRASQRVAVAKAMTFAECAAAYVEAHGPGWRSAKHAAQWTATLTSYAYPIMGDLPVDAIDIGLVLKALEPIWATKPETASRLRGRIEAVLDWARVRGYRTGENPARWKGNLDHLLPARSKVRAVEHHAALPYSETAAFVKALRQREGASARALEWTILTATRTGEALGARWEEINLAEKLWTIPALRMKGKREHRVPLSDAAISLLTRIPREGEYVFAGASAGKPLSNMAMLVLLRRMGRGDLTAHGFRSTFRDWAAERTNYPSEVVEMALAHAVGSKVEAAYRRGDLYEKRQRLMQAWADYCEQEPAEGGKVIALGRT